MATTEPHIHERPDPHDADAEDTVLGAMLLSPRAVEDVSQVLDPADYFRESNGRIHRAILALHKLGHPVDSVTVADRLEESGDLAEIPDGRERIRELVTIVPAAGNAVFHARIVQRQARRRRYLRIARTIAAEAYELDPDLVHAHAVELLTDATPRDEAVARIATLDEFISVHEDRAEALCGAADETLLPAGGLLIMGGEGGASKTTLTLDAIAHLASGTSWLGYQVNRPVRILIVENEGPRPQFRDKLRDKTESWRGKPFRNNVHVWEEPWARFSFARETDRRQLRAVTQEHRIDLVVADPLDSLGVIGAGTPEDTRTFISWLRECGLHNPDQPLAYWLLHHFNKSGQRSVVAQLSGAWGGHPDAILGIELGEGQTTKLTWGKLRHATPPADKTVVLVWDLETRGFHPVDRQPAADLTRVETTIREHVRDYPGQSRGTVEDAVHELLNRTEKVSRKQVRVTVERMLGGDIPVLAIRRGESPNGRYLFLAQTDNSPLADTLFGEHGEYSNDSESDSQTGNSLNTQLAARRPADGEYGELKNESPAPTRSEQLADRPPSCKEGAGNRRVSEDGPKYSPPDAANTPPDDDQPNDPPSTPRETRTAYVTHEGWLLNDDTLTTTLLERWPSIAAAEITELLELRARREAEELGTA